MQPAQVCHPRTPKARREEETGDWAEEHVRSTAAEITRQILPQKQGGSNKQTCRTGWRKVHETSALYKESQATE